MTNPFLAILAGATVICVAAIELVARLLGRRGLANRISEYFWGVPHTPPTELRRLVAWMQIFGAFPIGAFLIVAGLGL